MRIGMIGTGRFARRGPLPAISLAPGISLVAAYDPAPGAAAAAVAEQHERADVCASAEELISRRDVDAVMVVSPPTTHVDIVGLVLEGGKPVICEKPVSIGSRDCAALAARADAGGLPNAVDHEFRYDPTMRTMRDKIARGEIGQVRSSSLTAVVGHSVDTRFTLMQYWNFFYAIEQGGGVLPHFASHLLDLHMMMFGDVEPAGGHVVTNVPDKEIIPEDRVPGGGLMRAVTAEDTAGGVAILPGGAPASFAISYAAPTLPVLHWLIHGSEGALFYEGHEGWMGGTLHEHRLGRLREHVSIAGEVDTEIQYDLELYNQKLIAELLTDFAGVVGGDRTTGHFATLSDEARVWRLIEGWRGRSYLSCRSAQSI